VSKGAMPRHWDGLAGREHQDLLRAQSVVMEQLRGLCMLDVSYLASIIDGTTAVSNDHLGTCGEVPDHI
jgi:hypothetical protein